jgi:hypothetical protein
MKNKHVTKKFESINVEKFLNMYYLLYNYTYYYSTFLVDVYIKPLTLYFSNQCNHQKLQHNLALILSFF